MAKHFKSPATSGSPAKCSGLSSHHVSPNRSRHVVDLTTPSPTTKAAKHIRQGKGEAPCSPVCFVIDDDDPPSSATTTTTATTTAILDTATATTVSTYLDEGKCPPVHGTSFMMGDAFAAASIVSAAAMVPGTPFPDTSPATGIPASAVPAPASQFSRTKSSDSQHGDKGSGSRDGHGSNGNGHRNGDNHSKRKRSQPTRAFSLKNTFSFSMAPSAVVFGRSNGPGRQPASACSNCSSSTSSMNSDVSLPLPRALVAAWSSVHLEVWAYDHSTFLASRLFLLTYGKRAEEVEDKKSDSGSIIRYKRVAFGWGDNSLLVALSEISATAGGLKLQLLDLEGRETGSLGGVSCEVCALCPLSKSQWVVGLSNGDINFYSFAEATESWALTRCLASFKEPPIAIHRLSSSTSSSSLLSSSSSSSRRESRVLVTFSSTCVICSSQGEILEQCKLTGEQLLCQPLPVHTPCPIVLLASRMSEPQEQKQHAPTTSSTPPSFVLRAAELGSLVRYHVMSLPIPPTSTPSAVYCFASPIVALASTSSLQVLGAFSRQLARNSSSSPSSSFSSPSSVARHHYTACALLNGDVLVWSARTAQLLVFIDPQGPPSPPRKKSTPTEDKHTTHSDEPASQGSQGEEQTLALASIGKREQSSGSGEGRDKVVGLGFVPLHAIMFVCTADGSVRVFS